eukprot:GFYU01001944.1.p1 GENE.GFYU01001944.1~~GFYU01001944.1.p1  ORF type:complete len:243 (-),score=98.58 GFYU01001944.1:116-844(-)
MAFRPKKESSGMFEAAAQAALKAAVKDAAGKVIEDEFGDKTVVRKKKAITIKRNRASNIIGNMPGDSESEESDRELDSDDELLNDSDLGAIREARIHQMKKEFAQRQVWVGLGHGQYREITEEEFLEEVTKSERVICHFYHPEFERCGIMDKHLQTIAKKYLETKMIKLNVEKAPFFVEKLGIKTLPAVVLFKDGVADARIVGFMDLGGRDDFPTKYLERRLAQHLMINYDPDNEEDDGEDD